MDENKLTHTSPFYRGENCGHSREDESTNSSPKFNVGETSVQQLSQNVEEYVLCVSVGGKCNLCSGSFELEEDDDICNGGHHKLGNRYLINRRS